jgi:hypothetical protein
MRPRSFRAQGTQIVGSESVLNAQSPQRENARSVLKGAGWNGRDKTWGAGFVAAARIMGRQGFARSNWKVDSFLDRGAHFRFIPRA